MMNSQGMRCYVFCFLFFYMYGYGQPPVAPVEGEDRWLANLFGLTRISLRVSSHRSAMPRQDWAFVYGQQSLRQVVGRADRGEQL